MSEGYTRGNLGIVMSFLSYAVWGGDPVYPTINYEQDPDHVADYRNENMHEPIPDIVEMLREVSLHLIPPCLCRLNAYSGH